MKEKQFKPLLFPNKLASVKDGQLMCDGKATKQEDYMCSKKLDGIRTIIIPGVGIVSRSLKQIPNLHIHQKLQPLMEYCTENNIILDGEMFSPDLTFQDIISEVMTKGDKLPVSESLRFHCFDALKFNTIRMEGKQVFIDAENDVDFIDRLSLVPDHEVYESIMEVVEQEYVREKEYDLLPIWFKEAMAFGYEGLILKSVDGNYKYNRATVNESIGFKFKEYIHNDFEIVDVVQATEVREGAEKKINEMGHSVTSKKKDDRVLIEMASAFLVKFKDGRTFKASLAETHEKKKEIWQERQKYIGEFVEVKYMEVGSKDGIPRHPICERMRWRELDE